MNKKQLYDFIMKIWNDGYLQNSIGDYGEWNQTRLDEIFKEVLNEYIDNLKEEKK